MKIQNHTIYFNTNTKSYYILFYNLICVPNISMRYSFHRCICDMCGSSSFKKKRFYLFFKRGEGRKKERERNIDVWEKHQWVASCTPPAGKRAHNPGMSPDREWNQWPFVLQDDAQPIEPYHSGINLILFNCYVVFHYVDIPKFI